MSTWYVELKYSTIVELEVEANSYEDAIEKAKEEMDDFKSEYIDYCDIEFEDVIYVNGQHFRLGGR